VREQQEATHPRDVCGLVWLPSAAVMLLARSDGLLRAIRHDVKLHCNFNHLVRDPTSMECCSAGAMLGTQMKISQPALVEVLTRHSGSNHSAAPSFFCLCNSRIGSSSCSQSMGAGNSLSFLKWR